MQTSCGSRILGPYHPPYNATAIERLRTAGAVVIGKTNCDEFAMGSSNENSAFGPVKNPWDTERVPEDRRRSAAAVAAGLFPWRSALTQAVRLVSRLRVRGDRSQPTYGRVSRYGLVASDHPRFKLACLRVKQADAAAVLQVIAGRDKHDATTRDVPVPIDTAGLTAKSGSSSRRVPRAAGKGLDDEVRAAVEEAIDAYREWGRDRRSRSAHAKYAIAVYYIIATAEASSNLARYDGVRYGFRAEEAPALRDMYRKTRDEGFGPEVKRRIMLGTYVLSAGYYDAYYLKAQKVRSLIKQDFIRAFEKCDVIATPTSPTPAFLFGEKTDDPLAMYLNDIYTVTANLSGVPGISVPCGLSSAGLPIGLQLLGPYWSEARLFRLAHAYQSAHPFTARPSVHV